MKQLQHRSKTRAPHGSPVHNRQFGFWCTEEMYIYIMANGGSKFVRELLDVTRGSPVVAAPKRR